MLQTPAQMEDLLDTQEVGTIRHWESAKYSWFHLNSIPHICWIGFGLGWFWSPGLFGSVSLTQDNKNNDWYDVVKHK